jgi:hypothetical protein
MFAASAAVSSKASQTLANVCRIIACRAVVRRAIFCRVVVSRAIVYRHIVSISKSI